MSFKVDDKKTKIQFKSSNRYVVLILEVNETPDDDVFLTPIIMLRFFNNNERGGGERERKEEKKEDKSPAFHIKNVTNFSVPKKGLLKGISGFCYKSTPYGTK